MSRRDGDGDNGRDADAPTAVPPRLVLAEETLDDTERPSDAPDETPQLDEADESPEPPRDAATESLSDGERHRRTRNERSSPHSPAGKTLRARRKEQRKPTQALVYVQKLTKLYPIQRGWLRRPQLVHALNSVSFYIRRQETFGLVGESGCGKSTLGRCLIRLTEPTVGRVIFDGRDVTSLPPAELRLMRQRMQIVFQNPFSSLNPIMTAGEIVREGIDIFRLAKTRDDADERVARLLERVGLNSDMMDRYPHEFSGGQRQRIAIARALAVEPDFIVLDEPLTALDLSVQAQIVNLLDDLQQSLGLTLLFISHDLRTVQYLAHRMAVMYGGKFMEMGPTGAVTRKRLHPYTRALFDSMPRTPWLDDGISPPSDALIPSDRAPRSADAPRTDALPPSDRSAYYEPAGPVSSQPVSRLRPGSPPNAIDPPRGCPLFARCPRAETGQCDEEDPDLIEITRGTHHRVACWHPHLD